jgi:hypothetical protein
MSASQAQSSMPRTRGIVGAVAPGGCANASRSSVSAPAGAARRAASLDPASPPSAKPRWCRNSSSRPVRRPEGRATSVKRSAKVWWGKTRFEHRKRRSIAGVAGNGRVVIPLGYLIPPAPAT